MALLRLGEQIINTDTVNRFVLQIDPLQVSMLRLTANGHAHTEFVSGNDAKDVMCWLLENSTNIRGIGANKVFSVQLEGE